MKPATATDADLVELSIQGNRDAFRDLVERHQSLVCSLAYARCGDFQLSEEIAQETFLTAWRKLRDLQDSDKCKSWLCGIARNLTQNALRRRNRAATDRAEELDENTHSPEISPHEHAVSREEQTMLWRALEALPENYREPMILFYREADSVAAVARALDISEDAVKQRLSRGRVMLAGQIERSIRAALRASAPGEAFTLGVLSAIPALTISAKAASLGATAVRGGAAAKVAMLSGVFGALIGPVLMLLGNYLGYRVGIECARTDKERKHFKRLYLRLLALVAALVVVFDGIILWSGPHTSEIAAPLAVAFVALALAFTGGGAWLMISGFRERRWLIAEREAEGIPLEGDLFWEYRSKFQLFGLPFVHLRFGDSFGFRETPVKAWVAAGDRAFGLLFAYGGVAVAPVSVGGFAVGLICWGGFTVGLFAFGGFCLGWWAFGGVAFGWKAFAGCAVAWRAAMGGVAVARDFAIGGFAFAAQANNAIASHWLRAHSFFRNVETFGEHYQWLNILWVLPILQWWLMMKRHRNRVAARAQPE